MRSPAVAVASPRGCCSFSAVLGAIFGGRPKPSAPDAWPVRFIDVAAEPACVTPRVYGGVDRKRFIIETNGAGVALLDYDDDGWLDALVLSGTRLEEDDARDDARGPPARRPTAGSIATAATGPSRT